MIPPATPQPHAETLTAVRAGTDNQSTIRKDSGRSSTPGHHSPSVVTIREVKRASPPARPAAPDGQRPYGAIPDDKRSDISCFGVLVGLFAFLWKPK
jgi:hypothetical protein